MPSPKNYPAPIEISTQLEKRVQVLVADRISSRKLYRALQADDQSMILVDIRPRSCFDHVAEAAYLLSTRLGTEPEVRFLGDLAAGAFILLP